MSAFLIIWAALTIVLIFWCVFLYDRLEKEKSINNMTAIGKLGWAKDIYEDLANELDIHHYDDIDADPADFVKQAVMTVWEKHSKKAGY